jgi:transcriptional regulator with XRE-family HTH domain
VTVPHPKKDLPIGTLKSIERQVLRRARLQRELSQAELGARLGISQQAIAKLEDPDQNTTIESLRRAAEALNADVSIRIELRPS